MRNTILTGLALAFMAGTASAAPVDLSTWLPEYGEGIANQSSASWNLAGDNNSVTQSVNSDPSVFWDGLATTQGKALNGTIKVNTSSDDDFIGFVLGFDAGELDGGAGSTDYWLVDWKQGTQEYAGVQALAGLSLSHVTGYDGVGDDLWGHHGVVDEVARGTLLGGTGWTDGFEHSFQLSFTSGLIQIWVDGNLEISHAGSFQDGGFGFYNYSQGNVTYAGIQKIDAPAIPLPAGLPLLVGALGLLGFVRRRKA